MSGFVFVVVVAVVAVVAAVVTRRGSTVGVVFCFGVAGVGCS